MNYREKGRCFCSPAFYYNNVCFRCQDSFEKLLPPLSRLRLSGGFRGINRRAGGASPCYLFHAPPGSLATGPALPVPMGKQSWMAPGNLLAYESLYGALYGSAPAVLLLFYPFQNVGIGLVVQFQLDLCGIPFIIPFLGSVF